MIGLFRQWRRQKALDRIQVSDAQWADVEARLPFLGHLNADERQVDEQPRSDDEQRQRASSLRDCVPTDGGQQQQREHRKVEEEPQSRQRNASDLSEGALIHRAAR